MESHLVLSLARIATAALAGIMALVAVRAYFMFRRRSLLVLATGATAFAGGHLAAGIIVEILGWDLQLANTIEAVVTLIAVILLVASIYVRDPTRVRKGASRIEPKLVES